MKTLNLIMSAFLVIFFYITYRALTYIDTHEQSVTVAKSQIEKQMLVVDSISKAMDSLNNKLMVVTIDKQRYEVAINLFKEEDSVAAKKLEKIINESE